MKDNRQTVMEMLALIMQLGITMLVPIFACTVFAAYLGRRYQILWLAVAGFVIGAVSGVRACWILIRRYVSRAPKDPRSIAALKEGRERRENFKEDQ